MKKRITQLDFLRGIAILLVLFRHHRFNDTLQLIGWVGVDLFFVLSGFLISSLIYEEEKKTGAFSASRFLIRRGFKIYPIFYLFISISVVFILTSEYFFNYHKPDFFKRTLIECFFLQNYSAGLWGHTWSLAVEEHFYLLICFLLWGIINRFRSIYSFLPVIYCLFIIVIVAIRILNYHYNSDIGYLSHMYPTHLRMDSLMVGCLLSYYYAYKKNQILKTVNSSLKKILLAGGSLSLLIVALSFSLFSEFMVTIGFTLISISFAGLLHFFLNVKEQVLNSFFVKPVFTNISRIGFYSYSIYLFHMFLPSIFENTTYFNSIDYRVRFFLYSVVSIGAGAMVYIVVESRVLKFRDQYYPRLS